MNKIYDCFSFYNELDLLEIRLQELYNHVDHFVISEANTTHSGKLKEFNLENNWDRFKLWADKIIYIKVEDMPGVIKENRINPITNKSELWDNCWHNERHQRNCLIRGLGDAEDDDIILLGDLDEFIRPSSLEELKNDYDHNFWGFRMPMFNYRFNYMWTTPLIYQVQTQAMTVARCKTFPNLSHIREIYGTVWANRTNEYSDAQDHCLQHSGWHFSSIGTSEDVSKKLSSFAHSELAYQAGTIDVEKLIAENKTSLRDDARFEPVALDDYFPKTILDNQEKYKNLIIPNATVSAKDLLPCLASALY
jgi:hypothetical protein